MDNCIVVFGTGKFFQNRKKILYDNGVHITAFLDNDVNKQGSLVDDVRVCSPDKINEICYDEILLMTANAEQQMKTQLLSLGVPPEKIVCWKDIEKLIAWASRDVFVPHYSDILEPDSRGKRILVITETFCFNGGAMAAVYAAEAFKSKGYSVVMAAPIYEMPFVEEMNRRGLNLIVIPSLKFMFENTLSWIKKEFDVAFVNTFCMLKCACECNKIMPTVWWIHEPSDRYQGFYKGTIGAFPECTDINVLKKIDTYAVSDIAADNFNEALGRGVLRKKLPLAIPDDKVFQICKSVKKTIFVTAGDISERKGQVYFFEAAKILAKTRNDFEFWMVGRKVDSMYCRNLMYEIAGCDYIRFLGPKTHTELRHIFCSADVVVCPSLEETLSICIVEGMMYGKTCITTNMTGIAEYIEDGKNGFVIKAGNIDELASKVSYCIDNHDVLTEIGKMARLTYEKNFTMGVFEENVYKAVKNCEATWR